ncbi:MAG TPA: hypothetical protein VGD38_19775 [Pyrinomonadaceae bacterium]
MILYGQAGYVFGISEATQMLVCIVKATDPEVEKAEIVFDGREITSVPC